MAPINTIDPHSSFWITDMFKTESHNTLEFVILVMKFAFLCFLGMIFIFGMNFVMFGVLIAMQWGYSKVKGFVKKRLQERESGKCM